MQSSSSDFERIEMGDAARTGMKYCSSCGNEVTRKWIEQDGRERYVCDACATVHYENLG